MFDEFRYGSGVGGGARKQGRTAAQPPRVPQRASDDRLVDGAGDGRVFVLGGNGTTLAVTSSFRPVKKSDSANAIVKIHLIPIAWTPLGVAIGTAVQDVGIPLAGVVEWLDRTFPAEDEHAFIASVRDVEMLARVEWEAPFPERVDDAAVLNLEDLPDEISEGLAHPPSDLVACATCRSLCVRDDFVWKEKQLCAWDYHAAVFGKRGPWHAGVYEERHFESIPSCAYVATPLLGELAVDEVLTIGEIDPNVAYAIVNASIAGDRPRPYMAVKTVSGFSVLRET